jgi:hypothetical protein
MKVTRSQEIGRLLGFAVIGLAGSLAAPEAWSQQKYSVSYTVPAAASRYTEEHVIDVGDVPGHQVRVFELRYDDSMTGLAFAGVKSKETWTRGTSDFINGNGIANNYNVRVMEDGSKIYGRLSVVAQAGTNAEGAKVLKFSAVETLVGGTGKFSRIRGTIRTTAERVVGATALSSQYTGEYWFDE